MKLRSLCALLSFAGARQRGALVKRLLFDEPRQRDDFDAVDALPSPDIKYGNELLVQFIFGSAAYQLANPADKGVLLPGQLAGMRSVLKAYRSVLAHDPKAHIPRLDELVQQEAAGTFAAEIEKSVAANCSEPKK